MDYAIDWASPFRSKLASIDSSEIDRKVNHYYNDHHQIIQSFKRIAMGMKPREFLMRSVWKKISQGVYVLWLVSCDHPSSSPGQHGSVRGTMKSGLMVQEVRSERRRRREGRSNEAL